MEFRATARYVRVSPRKARQVADLIRGRRVNAALDVLRFTPRRAARHIEKVVHSALANAEEESGFDAASLVVREAAVEGGPPLKRLQMRAMGRANRILHRTSHIRVVLEDTASEGGR